MMMNSIRQSDEAFVELAHDEVKRASTLADWQRIRKMFLGLSVLLFGVIIFVEAINSFNTTYMSAANMGRSAMIMLFAVLFSGLLACDNKVKLILCIEEMQKKKTETTNQTVL